MAGAFFRNVEFTADHRNRVGVLLQMWHNRNVVWSHSLPDRLSDAIDTPSIMTDGEFKTTISKAMRDHLNIVSQMHLARLEQMFPRAIKDVELGYDVTRGVKTLVVKFKNGHEADCDEGQAKSQEFLAKCTMLYDLPAIVRNGAP